MFVVKIVVAVIIVEAIAEISTEAEIFEGLRGWFDPKPEVGEEDEEPSKMGIFVRCGYCQSVWLGWIVAYVLNLEGIFPWLSWGEPLVWGLLIHRASNIWHETVSRHLARAPLALFLRSWRREEGSPRPEKGGDGDGAV